MHLIGLVRAQGVWAARLHAPRRSLGAATRVPGSQQLSARHPPVRQCTGTMARCHTRARALPPRARRCLGSFVYDITDWCRCNGMLMDSAGNPVGWGRAPQLASLKLAGLVACALVCMRVRACMTARARTCHGMFAEQPARPLAIGTPPTGPHAHPLRALQAVRGRVQQTARQQQEGQLKWVGGLVAPPC